MESRPALTTRHQRERDREKLVTVEKDSLVCGHSSGGHMGLSDSCDQVDCSRYCQYTVIILNEWKRNLGSDRILIKYSDCYEGVLLADSDPVLQRQTEVRSSMERTVSQALFQWLTELSEGDLQKCAVDRLDQHTCSHRVTEWAHRAQASVWSDSDEYEDTQNKPKDATSQQRHTQHSYKETKVCLLKTKKDCKVIKWVHVERLEQTQRYFKVMTKVCITEIQRVLLKEGSLYNTVCLLVFLIWRRVGGLVHAQGRGPVVHDLLMHKYCTSATFLFYCLCNQYDGL